MRVLLVEDSAADAAIIRVALTASRFGCFDLNHVRRLADAAVQIKSAAFDAILLDPGLPDSQGLATLQSIRRVAPHVPIVILTNLSDERLAIEALHQGAHDYLVKSEADRGNIARSLRYVIERGRAEEAVRERDAELAHLSRVYTMGQMASGLAHELNQPLGAISNYAAAGLTRLESGDFSPETISITLRDIACETRRAADIVSHMRSFIRKGQPNAEPVDVNGLIERSLALLHSELRRMRIVPATRLGAGLPRALIDPVQIEQVLVNLLCNAMDAMATLPERQRSLSLQTGLDHAGRLCVSVADSGPGMESDVLSRLFEPFFTTKSNGLGMGLNISRSIVESHGGRLTAARNDAGGMHFRFTLPVADKGLACKTTQAA